MAIELTPDAQRAAAPATVQSARGFSLAGRFGTSAGRGRAGLNERIVFTECLSLLLATGVSLAEAFKAMQQETENLRLKGIMISLADTVSEGKRFSEALAMHPQMFSATYVSLVAAAEEGGFLPQVLDQLLKMDEKQRQLHATLIGALSYPAFLMAFSVAVIAFILIVIFPKFEELFKSIRDQLPASTVFLMALSSHLRAHWLAMLVGLVTASWLLRAWVDTASGKLVIDKVRMSLPVIKDTYVQIYLSQSLSVLGLSLANGVPITVALKACQNVVGNAVFARFLERILANVTEGRGIAIGFVETRFVPPMVRRMVSAAEQTGNLAPVMTRVAEFYGRELSKRITLLSKAIEPVMLIIMGVVVGLTIVSLILPIFKLSRAVH